MGLAGMLFDGSNVIYGLILTIHNITAATIKMNRESFNEKYG